MPKKSQDSHSSCTASMCPPLSLHPHSCLTPLTVPLSPYEGCILQADQDLKTKPAVMNTARGESISFSQELGTCCPHTAARELCHDTAAWSFQVTWGALSHTVAESGVPCVPGDPESHDFGDGEITNLSYAHPCPTIARFYPTVSLKAETACIFSL